MKVIAKVLISLIVIVILIGAVAMIYAFIDNGQRNFYIQYGNEKISYKLDDISLQKNAYNIFFCKNLLAISDDATKATNYTVSVVVIDDAFADIDFSAMKMDGIPTNSFLTTDVTDAFDIYIDSGYFIIYLPSTLTPKTVLNKVYPNVNITGAPNIDLYEKDYFYIQVYSEEEQSTITIGFH